MKGIIETLNKLEMIKLEPYEAPALEEISAVALLHGSSEAVDTNPSGAPDPGNDPAPIGGDYSDEDE